MFPKVFESEELSIDCLNVFVVVVVFVLYGIQYIFNHIQSIKQLSIEC